jgi:hypothetical protein
MVKNFQKNIQVAEKFILDFGSVLLVTVEPVGNVFNVALD